MEPRKVEYGLTRNTYGVRLPERSLLIAQWHSLTRMQRQTQQNVGSMGVQHLHIRSQV